MFSGPEIEFVETFDAAAADVWKALREAPSGIPGLSVTGVDDAGQTVFISGGITPSTWGQKASAAVIARGDTCDLHATWTSNFYSITAGRKIKQRHQALIDAITARVTRR